jgi:hypothetical protein
MNIQGFTGLEPYRLDTAQNIPGEIPGRRTVNASVVQLVPARPPSGRRVFLAFDQTCILSTVCSGKDCGKAVF